MTGLPMYFPQSFDLNLARLCAELVSYAYDMYSQWKKAGSPSEKAQFQWKKPSMDGFNFSNPIWSSQNIFSIIHEKEPFGYVATVQNTGYLIYRGTESLNDWLDNLESTESEYPYKSGMGRVHHGFLNLYTSLRKDQSVCLNASTGLQKLILSGHSLGCGLTTLALPDILTQSPHLSLTHYNFASPRVGNATFANHYNTLAPITYRLVNTCDLVPEVPPSIIADENFKHVGVPVDYTAQYKSITGNHSLTNSYMYALNHPDSPENS